MSIIAATRRGFLYQDRAAVAIYLESFQRKTLREFYVDYPIASRQSLDIRLVDSDGETVYEVKSGEEFKRNKRINGSSAVRDALITLNECRKDDARLILLIRKGIQNNIADLWRDLKQLQAHSFVHPPTRKCANALAKELALPGIQTGKELHSFCQSFDLCDYFDDKPDNDGDRYSSLDDTVISKINDLAEAFGAANCRAELPDDWLMFDLYHHCCLHAGTEKDMHPILKERICQFFARRIHLEESSSRVAPPPRDRATVAEKMRNKIDQYLGAPSNTGTDGIQPVEGMPYEKR